MDEYKYVFRVDLDYEDHTEARPFCWEDNCPCHEDQSNLDRLQTWYDEGLIGAVDGDNIYHGRTI